MKLRRSKQRKTDDELIFGHFLIDSFCDRSTLKFLCSEKRKKNDFRINLKDELLINFVSTSYSRFSCTWTTFLFLFISQLRSFDDEQDLQLNFVLNKVTKRFPLRWSSSSTHIFTTWEQKTLQNLFFFCLFSRWICDRSNENRVWLPICVGSTCRQLILFGNFLTDGRTHWSFWKEKFMRLFSICHSSLHWNLFFSFVQQCSMNNRW